jgi:hypothetical protein
MREMVIKGGNGRTARGHWWTDGVSVTVRSTGGKQKTMCLDGSTPRCLARFLLLLMEEERRGPMPPTPKEIREANGNCKRDIAEDRFKRMADYAARGRRFKNLSDARLLKVWTAAHDKMEDGPADDVAQEALTFDLDAEFEIRGTEPPYQEWPLRRWANVADKSNQLPHRVEIED